MAETTEKAKLNIKRIPTGPLAANSYVVWREGSGHCVVTDPAGDGRILGFLRENGLTADAILVTHGHFDHILGLKALKDATDATIYVGEYDAPALTDPALCLASMIGARYKPCVPDVLLSDDDVFTEAGMTFRTLFTPGHTPGGVCYILEDERIIFSGDTLFRMSYGRSDLPGGNSAALADSLIYRLFALKGDYRVLPGHEGETTLEFERNFNPCARSGVCE